MLAEDELDRIRGIVAEGAARENVPDILAGGLALGQRRAELLGRPLEADDVLLSLSLFCFNPFKPPALAANTQFLVERRQAIFAEASAAPDRLVATVPDEVLTMGQDQIFDLLQHQPIEAVLRFPEEIPG